MRKLKTIILLVTITALCVLTAIMPSVSAESGYIYYLYTPLTIVANTHNFGGILLESNFDDGSYDTKISIERVKSGDYYVFNVIQYQNSAILHSATIPSLDNALDWQYIMINMTYEQGERTIERHISYQYVAIKGTEIKYYQGGEDFNFGTAFGSYIKPIETNATVPGSYFITLYANAQSLFESSFPTINSDINTAIQQKISEAYDNGHSDGYSVGYSQGLYDGSQEAGGFWEGTISLIRLCAEKLWDFLSFEIAPGIKMGYITLGVPLLIGTISLILRKIFGGGKDDD